MTPLEKINEISKKISVKKDGDNPYYKSKYITLDNIMEHLQPLLDEYKMVVHNVNIPHGVKTIVTDIEEAWTIESEFTIDSINDPQALGKVLTYGRRYNLTSIFNILADEDDDAQSFYKEEKKEKQKPYFGLKELENLKLKKDQYTYEQALKKVKDNYNIEKFMENKIMDLYGVTAGDLFE